MIQQLQAAAVTGANQNGISGPTGLELPPPLNPTPPAPNPTREVVVDKCLQRIMNTVADLNDREQERTERENNIHRQNVSNHNVLSPRAEDEEHQLVNMSQMSDNFVQRVQQHRRAGEAAPPRPTGQYHNPDQMVTERLAGLGEQAAARRSGGQGVYNAPYYGIGQQCPPDLTQYNQYNEAQLHGGSSAEPARRISSGRDRTGNDGTTRIYIPWPNEHCLIGIERRKVKYDQLNQARMACGADEHPGNAKRPTYKTKHVRSYRSVVSGRGGLRFCRSQGCPRGGPDRHRGGEGQLGRTPHH